MFVGHQVRQDDPRMETVYAHFERNLADILRTGTSHGAKIVVSTVISNLKDCAPFASEHRPDLTEGEKENGKSCIRRALERKQPERQTKHSRAFRWAAKIDRHFADLQFRWGRLCLALERDEEARWHFILARDEDTLRFRGGQPHQRDHPQSRDGPGKGGHCAGGRGAHAGGESPHGLPGRSCCTNTCI